MAQRHTYTGQRLGKLEREVLAGINKLAPHGPFTRVELARQIGSTHNAIARTVVKLVGMGMLHQDTIKGSPPGQPRFRYRRTRAGQHLIRGALTNGRWPTLD